MSEPNLRTTTDRHRRRPAFSVAILAMLTVVTSVVAEDPPPQNADNCTFDEQPLAVVRTTTASGFDLQVTLDWSHTVALPATAELRLYDGRGVLVTATIVSTAAGRRTVAVLPGALNGLFTLGFQYRLEVVDLLSGTAMAAPHHLRVFIDCPASGLCSLRTVDGLEADRLVIDKQLMLLLDHLENSPSIDLLGDALGTSPDLRGEILTLAKQLGDLAQEYPLDGCVCVWLPSSAESPHDEQSLDPAIPSVWPYADSETGGSKGPGAAFGAGVQIVRGLPHSEPLGGLSEAIMDLRCWNFTDWSMEAFQLGSYSNNFQIPIPVLEPCQQSCGAEIRSQVDLDGKLEVEAYGTVSDGASATAYLNIFHKLYDQTNQGHQLFSAYASTEVNAEAQGASTDLVCTHKAADQTLPGNRLSAVIDTAATMNVEASYEAYALAIASVGFGMKVTGEAPCAVESTASIRLSANIDDGSWTIDDGLEIERWGHPR